MPVWFPWIFVGGIIFIILSFLGAKYKNNQYKSIQLFQDFISGAILVGFVGVLMPDMFPKMELPTEFPLNLTGGNFDTNTCDIDLQVGPPRLIGR